MYQYLALHDTILKVDDPPTREIVRRGVATYAMAMNNVFLSLLVFAVVATVLHGAYAACFAWMFHKHSQVMWERICDVEDALLVTDSVHEHSRGPAGSLVFGGRQDIHTPLFHDFVKHWSSQHDEHIIEQLDSRARCIMQDISHGNQTAASAGLEMDAFNRALEHSKPNASLERRCASWNLLSADGLLTQGSIESALYDLFFAHKRLALQLATDHRILHRALLYASAAVYPACAIVSAQLFG
jgi:hypothetical protein